MAKCNARLEVNQLLRRTVRASVHRLRIVRRFIDKNGRGLEIGPSFNPIAPKRKGYKVEIIDHLSRADLIAEYADAQISLYAIEEVDFIWKGEPYTELTGKRHFYDWVIASHVVEHMPDLIGFLNDCDHVLTVDGVLVLVIPDKNCFDHFRPLPALDA